MIQQVLWALIKEEWRLHTKTMKNQSFRFFPFIILIATLFLSLLIPTILKIISISQLFLYTHYFFLFFGVSVGAFGLFGKEIMNRRFGQISLIAYSSRSLPISEKTIFLLFFLKDIIYYLMLWILPIFIGFLLVTSFVGFSFFASFYACGTLLLSFLFGLSFVFLLSTIYAHSKTFLLIILITITGIIFYFNIFEQIQISSILLPYLLFYTSSWTLFGYIILSILFASSISIIFVKIDYPEKKKYYQNSLSVWIKRLRFSPYSCYIAKDFIDLKRSEGGLGKVIFSFLLPVFFTYFFLSIFVEIIPTVKILMIFSIFLGVVSASIYNMITEFDSFHPYLALPVKVSTIIKSKIISFLLINAISCIILIIAGITMDQLSYFIPALLLFVSIALFILGVTIHLTGLQPTLLLYDSKIFIRYAGILAPTVFVLTLLSIINPYLMIASPLLIPLAYILLRKSFVKWNAWNPINI